MASKRTSLALQNLASSPTRAAVSLLGVTFAVLLIFMQLGFRGAVAYTATVVYSKLKFDILIQSTEYLHLYETRFIDRSWLAVAEEHPSVESVEPFWIMLQKWQTPTDGNFRAISMMAMAPDASVLDVPEIQAQRELFRGPDNVLIDLDTRPDYGPANGKKFGEQDIGTSTELGGRDVTIRGTFLLGTGLATNGAVLISDTGFDMRAPISVQQKSSLGLVTIKEGQDVDAVAQSLRKLLSQTDSRAANSVVVLTREEAMRKELRRWLGETPIGIIFTLGVGIAFIVGAVIVYMVLSQDVSNRLSEYATLKAMGYSPWHVAGIVLKQGWLLAAGGLLLAIGSAYLLYFATSAGAGIPIQMTSARLLGVSILAFTMCTLSGFGAIRMLWKAEPASLF